MCQLSEGGVRDEFVFKSVDMSCTFVLRNIYMSGLLHIFTNVVCVCACVCGCACALVCVFACVCVCNKLKPILSDCMSLCGYESRYGVHADVYALVSIFMCT